MATTNTPSSSESNNALSTSPDLHSRVMQPKRLDGMDQILDVINVMGSISEKMSERAPQMGGGAMTSQGDQGQSAGKSKRDDAIANLPKVEVMQKKLVDHIDNEINDLKKIAKKISASKEIGWAYKLNQIYARIRRLAALAGEILNASLDVIKRFYILVFIDEQPLLRSAR